MTQLLLRLFLKNKPATDSDSRAAIGKLSGAVGIIFNILLCLFKLLVGSISGSISVTADAMNNLSDASGSVVTLLGFKLAEKPADPDHPYGHARFEYLSGLGVAALIILICFELAKSSVEKIFSSDPVIFSYLSVTRGMCFSYIFAFASSNDAANRRAALARFLAPSSRLSR